MHEQPGVSVAPMPILQLRETSQEALYVQLIKKKGKKNHYVLHVTWRKELILG